MKALLKKWWKKSLTRAIGFDLSYTTNRGTTTNISLWLTWQGVFIWGAVLTWVIFEAS